MNSIRRAVLNGEMDTMPVDLRTWDGPVRPVMDPPYTDYRYYWCPVLYSRTLFWYATDGMEEEIYRYPAVLDTDWFFQEAESESQWTDGNQDNGLEENSWFEAMGPVDTGNFWEPPGDNGQLDTNEEANEDESNNGNEDWAQPPPINTTGLEWFYE